MSIQEKYWVKKELPSAALNHLVRAAAGVPDATLLSVVLSTAAGRESYGNNRDRLDPDVLLADSKFKTTCEQLDESAVIRLKRAEVRFHVTPHNATFTLSIQRETINDHLILDGADAGGNRPIATSVANSVLQAIGNAYDIIPDERHADIAKTSDGEIRNEILAQLIQGLSEAGVKLNQAIADGTKSLLEQSIEHDRKVRDTIDSERARMRVEDEKARAILEQERAKAREEEEKARVELQAERQAFELAQKDWNDNESRRVRRDLLNKIQSLLSDQTENAQLGGGKGDGGVVNDAPRINSGKAFKLSADTNQKAGPIQYACLGLAVLAVAGIVVSGIFVFGDAEAKWHHILPLTSSIMILVSTVIYYIRWNDGWLGRHADLEIRNQLLRQDMLRASWFAEMLFQYKDERQGTLPESVIQVMTKNLFAEQGGAEPAKHPADDLTGFLKRINRVRLGQGDVEMEAAPAKKK